MGRIAYALILGYANLYEEIKPAQRVNFLFFLIQAI